MVASESYIVMGQEQDLEWQSFYGGHLIFLNWFFRVIVARAILRTNQRCYIFLCLSVRMRFRLLILLESTEVRFPSRRNFLPQIPDLVSYADYGLGQESQYKKG